MWRKLVAVISGLVIGALLGIITGLKFSNRNKIKWLDYERMWVI